MHKLTESVQVLVETLQTSMRSQPPSLAVAQASSSQQETVTIPVAVAQKLLESLLRAQEALNQAKLAAEAMARQFELESQVVERVRVALQHALQPR